MPTTPNLPTRVWESHPRAERLGASPQTVTKGVREYMRTENEIRRRPTDPEVNQSQETDETAPRDLTFGEAAGLYDISKSSLRRKLKAKKVPGAFQVSDGRVDEWRIPPSGLEKLGIEKRVQTSPEEPSPRVRPGLEVGILSGFFIDLIKEERARRRDIETEKLHAEAQRAATDAHSHKLRDELIKHRRELVAAHQLKAAAEKEREAAQMEAWRVAAKLRDEHERQEEEEVAAPTLAQTWGSRIGWSFFGVAATISALILVASLLLDTLLSDRGTTVSTPKEPTGSGSVRSPGSGTANDGSQTAGLTGASGAGPSAGSPNEVMASTTRGFDSARRRGGGSGERANWGPDAGVPVAVTTGRGSDNGPTGGSDGTGAGPAGDSGSGSGDETSGSGSSGGSAPGSTGGAGGGAAGEAGDTLNGATGDAQECVCGAVSGAAEAAGSAGGTAGDAAQGAGDAVAGAAEAGSGAGDAAGDAVDAAADAVGGAVPPLP